MHTHDQEVLPGCLADLCRGQSGVVNRMLMLSPVSRTQPCVADRQYPSRSGRLESDSAQD